MITLALELSSRYGSVALLCDRDVLAEKTWDEKTVRGQHLFGVLPGMLRDASIPLEAIDFFAVGRGPGSYSGMRVAITAAQCFALPGQKTVYALSSGEALAQEIANRENVPSIAVVGDARRGMVWLGIFKVLNQTVEQVNSWTVLTPDQLGTELSGEILIVSPDRHKLSAILNGFNFRCLEEDLFPKAKYVGHCALRKMDWGLPSEPLTPIYTQPAVVKMDSMKKS